MLPRWHFFGGAIFTLVIWYFAPSINLFYLLLIFLASFLMDFDHYVTAVSANKSFSLGKAVKYHSEKRDLIFNPTTKKNLKEDFHLFHTIEFQSIIGLIGIFFTPFFYIFIGMIFHSLLDLIFLISNGAFLVREYSLISWLIKKKSHKAN